MLKRGERARIFTRSPSATRGVSNASRRGEEGYLLDLLGHAEVAVRSWAAEGLARLGDARALPVLTGTLRHEPAPPYPRTNE